jgi:hypothetical protein
VSYNSDFRERQAASTKAKAALLERFRAAPGPNDPERRGRDEARVRVIEARQARAAAREAARIEREKAARDARYAARKEAKKQRRQEQKERPRLR